MIREGLAYSRPTVLAPSQQAVHRGDRTAVKRLFAEFGERTAEENELLNRLGGDCSVGS
jgi:hypothetical protein